MTSPVPSISRCTERKESTMKAEYVKIQCDSFAKIQSSLKQMSRWKDELYRRMEIGGVGLVGIREALQEVNGIAETFLRESEIHRAAELADRSEQKAAA